MLLKTKNMLYKEKNFLNASEIFTEKMVNVLFENYTKHMIKQLQT